MTARPPSHPRVLVVEDEYMIAADLRVALQAEGVEVVGPVSNVAAARTLLEQAPVDLAILDVDLGGEVVWPLADELMAKGAPILLATGYSRSALPKRYAALPRSEKPTDVIRMVREMLP
ncbi:response regulator [Brevundimonas staleyi]|uniref:Response regulator n=1 Tax=Brevundimonas staleyi TaxID=74326 RepID=A0ABW0FS28_9CAUL